MFNKKDLYMASAGFGSDTSAKIWTYKTTDSLTDITGHCYFPKESGMVKGDFLLVYNTTHGSPGFFTVVDVEGPWCLVTYVNYATFGPFLREMFVGKTTGATSDTFNVGLNFYTPLLATINGNNSVGIKSVASTSDTEVTVWYNGTPAVDLDVVIVAIDYNPWVRD